MCNKNCNKNSCNCNNQCNNCEPIDCGCKIELDTLCVYYTGQGISPLGVKSGQNLTEVLEFINNYLEFLLEETEALSAIQNIGDGVEIYAGRDDSTRANTLRTLKTSDSVEVIQNEETISFKVDLDNVVNIGFSGLDFYKGYNTTTSNHEIKRVVNSPTGIPFLYNNSSSPDNISQRGLTSTDNSVSVDSNETTVDIKVNGGTLPTGSIILWYGSILNIPSGYSLCDGSNSTPDLRDKFVVGASQDSNGVASTTIEGVSTVIGGSKDAILVEHGHTATSDVTDPGHRHPWGNGTDPDDDNTGSDDPEYTTQAGNIPADQSPVLSAQTGITVNTSVDNQGESATNKNLPPYYALAYIMFTGNN